MQTEPKHLALLGATGRLGRAVMRQGGSRAIVGMARGSGAEITGDRQQLHLLQKLLRGADGVIDLCAFVPAEAEQLCETANALHLQDVPLVFASSLAARRVDAWPTPIGAAEALPDDDYGRQKALTAQVFQRRWPGPVGTILLPQVVALDDPRARELAYIRDAQRLGYARISGNGSQKVALIDAGTAALVLLQALQIKQSVTLQLAIPHQLPLHTLVLALLAGAGLPAQWRPQGETRGPHSQSDERVDISQFTQQFPQQIWPDLLDLHRDLGARLIML